MPGGRPGQGDGALHRLCLDCADLCQACIATLGRNSEHARELCRVLADVCEACATECEKFGDGIMRQCAEACRQCAEACRQVARVRAAA